MARSAKEYFVESARSKNKTAPCFDKQLRVSLAALLVHMAHIDGIFFRGEQDIIMQAITRQFRLRDDEAAEIIEVIEHLSKDKNHVHEFIEAINDHLSDDQKEELLDLSWKVALADGIIKSSEVTLQVQLRHQLQLPA